MLHTTFIPYDRGGAPPSPNSYQTDDGTSADMSGQNKLIGDQAGIEMRGSYTYISPEGKTVTVT